MRWSILLVNIIFYILSFWMECKNIFCKQEEYLKNDTILIIEYIWKNLYFPYWYSKAYEIFEYNLNKIA